MLPWFTGNNSAHCCLPPSLHQPAAATGPGRSCHIPSCNKRIISGHSTSQPTQQYRYVTAPPHVRQLGLHHSLAPQRGHPMGLRTPRLQCQTAAAPSPQWTFLRLFPKSDYTKISWNWTVLCVQPLFRSDVVNWENLGRGGGRFIDTHGVRVTQIQQ